MSPPGDRERSFPRFAWGVLGYSLVVILWGYFLRISESGDGCGTDWPLCRGSAILTGAPFPTWVEFVHRISSGLVLLLVAAMAIWAFRRHPRRHPVRRAAAAALLFTVGESAFGAILVVFGLVASDVSIARIMIRPFHVTNTFLLMASLGLTAWWAHRGVEHPTSLWEPRARPVVFAALAVFALAWTGSWTGLASTAFPAETLSQGMRQYLQPEHVLIYLRMFHPFVALAAVYLLLRLAAAARRGTPSVAAKRLSLAVGGLALSQLVVGPLTILLLQPAALRLFHLLVADLLWLGVVFLGASMLEGHPAGDRALGS